MFAYILFTHSVIYTPYFTICQLFILVFFCNLLVPFENIFKLFYLNCKAKTLPCSTAKGQEEVQRSMFKVLR